MTSPGALNELKSGPLYFFDQPTRIKGTRSSILHLSVSRRGGQLEETSNEESHNREGKDDELTQRLTGETYGYGKPDTSPAVSPALNIKHHNPTDAYKRAAPQLLNELAGLLSQNNWIMERNVPHGIVNILNYRWQDLTAGAVHLTDPEQTHKRRRSRGSLKLDDPSRLVFASDEQETGRSDLCVVGNAERKPQVSSSTRMKKRKQNSKIAHDPTTTSFSILSSSCKSSGWIIKPKQPSCDELQQISLCQWVLQRLNAAGKPEKWQTAAQNQDKPLILHHYGNAKTNQKDRRVKRKSQPATLVNGIPQIPEVKQQNPAQQKLHYRINDGSSFIYYPSGCMAVCQSHSGLPCGGFYTNVFSDSQCPSFLATITAFGHGAVTHPLSSTITAVWDQDGGFICDHLGNITKQWRWKADHTLRGKIVIQLSDLISVRLFNGTSAMLSFRCNSESVQLPLSALSNVNQSKEMPCLQTDAKFTSDAAQNLLLAKKTESPAVFLDSKRNLTLTPVLQMGREVEELEEPSAQWRRGCHAGRELKRLQQRVRNTLDDWLAYYRAAIGIKCPDTKQMPDAPLRTRLRKEEQSAALPSLNPPERTDAKAAQPEQDGNVLQELQRHLSERAPDSSMKLHRTPRKQAREEHPVIHVGPLQIHGNIQLESVIIPKSVESQPYSVTRCPAPPSFTPSTPLTVCPVLLRAALLGEGRQRRCCCSTTQMPVVTDLEYDAFVMGQPPHSQQILVVCVTLLRQSVSTKAVTDQNTLEQLYRRRNKHRTMPCTQCQMDSFRLLRYEMSAVEHGFGVENGLLRQRHNAAPGMVLMYFRGKLLFMGYMFSDHTFSVTDLQKQISRVRGDYRLGLSLPPDYKFSDAVSTPTHTQPLAGGEDVMLLATVEQEKASERKHTKVPNATHKRQKAFHIKPKKASAFPQVPIITR